MAIPIALQLYSVRDDCSRDFFGTIRKVAAMGYEGVEFAGYHHASAEDLRSVLDDCGLQVEGTHCGIDLLSDENFDDTVQYHKVIGCNWLIVPWLPESMRHTEATCMATAQMLSTLSHKLEAVGMRCGFHCHSGDMKPLEGGVSAWDLIAANTPSSFLMQYDTANGMHGGADPVAPILKWPGRGGSVHLKEFSESETAVIGEGEVPWPAVFEACEKSGGTEWYVVEHEQYGDRTPLECVEACLKNLQSMRNPK